MKQKKEAGFSYIDVMIAMVILLVGILAMLSAITAAVLQSKGQELQVTAKQIASSTMESIMAVKETDSAQLGWTKIGNIGSNPNAAGVPQGIFLNGTHQISTDPGADEVLGTIDDTGTVMDGFRRQIIITDICDPDRPSPNCTPPGTLPVRVRTVEVAVTYFVGVAARQERITTVLTDY